MAIVTIVWEVPHLNCMTQSINQSRCQKESQKFKSKVISSPPHQCTSPDRWRNQRWSCCSVNQRLHSCSRVGLFLWPWTFLSPSFPRLGRPFCSWSSVVGRKVGQGQKEYLHIWWDTFNSNSESQEKDLKVTQLSKDLKKSVIFQQTSH